MKGISNKDGLSKGYSFNEMGRKACEAPPNTYDSL